MKIQTKYFGEQEISESDILSFPSGLPGFAQERRFILQPFSEVFSILQSLDQPQLAFVVTSPYLFFENYTLDLPDAFVHQLTIEKPEDVTVWVIVSVQAPLSDSTANLKAPIVLNMRQNLGKQYIAEQSTYSLRERLMMQSLEKRA